MPSPDVSTYVDLTLYDLEAGDIFQDALQYARAALPEWQPRVGSIELVMLQAMAQQVAELVATINRLPSGLSEVLLRMLDIERSQGEYATVDLTFTATTSSNHILPAGTRVMYMPESETSPYVFETDEEVELSGDPATGTVAATATEIGNRYNGLPSATPFILVTTDPFVSTVVTASLLDGGGDAETDAEYFARSVSALRQLNGTLCRPTQFEAYVAQEYPLAYRIKAIDLCDESYNLNKAGRLAVVVAPLDSSPLNLMSGVGYGLLEGDGDYGQKDIIRDDLGDRAVSILDIAVLDPVFVKTKVAATVQPLAGVSGSTVMQNCLDALADYLSANAWNWSQVVRKNEIIALLDQVAGVDWVESVTLTAVTSHTGDTLDAPMQAAVDVGTGDLECLKPMLAYSDESTGGDFHIVTVNTA